MSIHETTSINAPVGKVVEAFASEDFARHVSQQAGVQFESFSVDGDLTGPFTVTTVRSMGADKLPDVVQKFVKGGVKLQQVDSYDAPAQDGSRSVRTEIKAGALPVGATASQQLTATGDETKIDVNGSVQANIPLVGKKIAAAAEPYIGKALTLQAREAEAWIAGH